MFTDERRTEAQKQLLAARRREGVDLDVAEVEDLRRTGFKGPRYRAFEDRLIVAVLPQLRGMLRNGALVRGARKKCASRKIDLYVSLSDMELLNSSAAARDELAIGILVKTLSAFRRNALIKARWEPHHRGEHGPASLQTYFIGQCEWEFRGVYLPWHNQRQQILKNEAALIEYEELSSALAAPPHLSQPEAMLMLDSALRELLSTRTPRTQAILGLLLKGFSQAEIADRLGLTPDQVRGDLARLRHFLRAQSRKGVIHVPTQLQGGGERVKW